MKMHKTKHKIYILLKFSKKMLEKHFLISTYLYFCLLHISSFLTAAYFRSSVSDKKYHF